MSTDFVKIVSEFRDLADAQIKQVAVGVGAHAMKAYDNQKKGKLSHLERYELITRYAKWL